MGADAVGVELVGQVGLGEVEGGQDLVDGVGGGWGLVGRVDDGLDLDERLAVELGDLDDSGFDLVAVGLEGVVQQRFWNLMRCARPSPVRIVSSATGSSTSVSCSATLVPSRGGCP